ncbi:MAG: hypothetical protein J7K08_02225 [Thermoplasmata archaeon]|nr:hypothetical protein [Thermoplasmata archaeon]
MSINKDVTTALHPTEVYNHSSGLTALVDGPLLSIPTCRRPPLGLFSSASIFPTSPTHHSIPFYTVPSRMDTDEDGVTDYIELQGWDVIVIHERRGEVMEDRCEYGVWSLPIRYDSEGDGASDEIEWKFHGDPGSSDSDKDGIPDSEESGPNLTMVEGTPPVILDKKGRDKSSEKYSGAYIKTKVKVKTKWSISGVKIKGKIIVIFTVVDNAGLDKAVIYVQTGGERIIYLGGDKRREIEEVFDIGDLLRLIHGGYDVRVNVTDINGNWATGKTHIDSALQTLKKGLSALLDMIVAALKVIAKVASMLLEMMRNIIVNMLKPVLTPIEKRIETWLLNIKITISSIFQTTPSSALMDIGTDDIQRSRQYLRGSFVEKASQLFALLFGLTFYALLILTTILQVISMIFSGLLIIVKVALEEFKDLIIKNIMKIFAPLLLLNIGTGFSTVISSFLAGNERSIIIIIGSSLENSGWSAIASVLSIIGFINALFDLILAYVYKTKLLRSAVGFVLAMLGLVITFGVGGLIGDLVGLSISGLGLVLVYADKVGSLWALMHDVEIGISVFAVISDFTKLLYDFALEE